MPGFYDSLYDNIKDLSEKCPEFKNYYLFLEGMNRAGICYGLTHSWGFAVLSNDRSTFFKRLKFLILDYNNICSSGGTAVHEIIRLAKMFNIQINNGIALSQIVRVALDRIRQHPILMNGYFREIQKNHIKQKIPKEVMVELYSYSLDRVRGADLKNPPDQHLNSELLVSGFSQDLTQKNYNDPEIGQRLKTIMGLIKNYNGYYESQSFDLVVSIRGFLDRLLLLQSPYASFFDNRNWKKRHVNVLQASSLIFEKFEDHSGIILITEKTVYGKIDDYELLIQSIIGTSMGTKKSFYIEFSSMAHSTGLTCNPINRTVELFNPNYLNECKFQETFRMSDISRIASKIFSFHKSGWDHTKSDNDNHTYLLATQVAVYANDNTDKPHLCRIDEMLVGSAEVESIKETLQYEIEKYCNKYLDFSSNYFPSRTNKHKDRAKFTSIKLNIFRHIYTLRLFLQEEKNLLDGNRIILNSRTYHYKNNTPSSNTDKNDDYYKLIKNSLERLNRYIYKVDLDAISAETLNYIIRKYDIKSTRLMLIVCRAGQINILKKMLRFLNNNVRNYDYHYLLPHYAVYSGEPEMIKVLINAGADINSLEKGNYSTPLHTAAKYGSLDILNQLINYDANPKYIDRNGNTPLHIACQFGNYWFIEKLACGVIETNTCSYYLDVLNVKNKDGKTALDIAKERDDGEAVEILTKLSKL
ncbi:MAG: ankyrin repeat domain-containing protein [Lentisphaerae bacterium]|nr:ankyrin repeat domain-containing protein [Lentisphaerota bacterium]MCP4100114.1 ankyrin repeat domain-containing protein [Lentisphaerota bacterium]